MCSSEDRPADGDAAGREALPQNLKSSKHNIIK